MADPAFCGAGFFVWSYIGPQGCDAVCLAAGDHAQWKILEAAPGRTWPGDRSGSFGFSRFYGSGRRGRIEKRKIFADFTLLN